MSAFDEQRTLQRSALYQLSRWVPLQQCLFMKCPICRQAVSWEGNPNRPFCSERCRLIDLGNWANGQYSLAAEEINTEETDVEEQNVET